MGCWSLRDGQTIRFLALALIFGGFERNEERNEGTEEGRVFGEWSAQGGCRDLSCGGSQVSSLLRQCENAI